MSPEQRQSDTKQRDETLAGFAFSLVVAAFCMVLNGWPLMLLAFLPVAPAAWYLPWWRVKRPPRGLIKVGRILALLAGAVWLLSVVVHAQLIVSGAEAWRFGAGQIEHVRYSGRSPLPGNRDVTIGLDSLADIPFNILASVFGGGVGMGHGAGFSSYSKYWGTFAPLLCFIAPTWVLSRMRRDRSPINLCANCEYDLTGNVTGRCPECGRRFEASGDAGRDLDQGK